MSLMESSCFFNLLCEYTYNSFILGNIDLFFYTSVWVMFFL